MKSLDDIVSMKTLDPSGVLSSTELFPKQCIQAWNESTKIIFPKEYADVQNIVVCGMGGSRFTPKTVKELYRNNIRLPYEIVEDYTLPAYVNDKTLVILSTYSGSTEEVMSCLRDAQVKKAKITAVTQGGTIGDLLTSQHIPAYIFTTTNNPCGQPRIGSGYMLFGHIGILVSLGFLALDADSVITSIENGSKMASTYRGAVLEKSNQAKQLARKFDKKHIIVVTAEFLRGFGNGFANQLNETAKTMSDYRYIPELNHHLMEGLSYPEDFRKHALFVFFTSDLYSEQIRKRIDISMDVLDKQQIASLSIQLTGTNPLETIVEAYSLSGFVTFYMAMLNSVDPVAIPWVNYFKQQLARGA